MPKKAKKPARTPRKHPTRPSLTGLGRVSSGQVAECIAQEFNIREIHTDRKRFQNRESAFSEATAKSVALRYDPNKFDPIVLWRDPRDGRHYVLSGHSRLEGMKRRSEKTIPVRFYEGTEQQAIHFAKVEANRAATAETLAEDVAAFRLMRDGDAKGRNRATKAELEATFPGKAAKLEAYSHLAKAGRFMKALAAPDRSEFPHIESRAMWAGLLRKKHPALTRDHEDDIFTWLYSPIQAYKLDKDAFHKIVEERILLGRSRLFPECDTGSGDCRKVKSVEDALTNKRERELLKELKAAEWAIEAIRNRFNSTHPAEKAHTKEEKEALRALLKSYTADKTRLQKELGIADKEKDKPGLFGPARTRRAPRPAAHLEASHRRHAELQALSESIRKRLRSSDIAAKVYTEGERKVLTRLLAEAEDERLGIVKHLSMVQRERKLFE